MHKSDKAEGLDDIVILEELKMKIYNDLNGDKPTMKVGDLLKIIELKNKLSISGRAEKKFWKMVNQIRREGLTRPKKKSVKQSKPEEKK
jgi:hypothetical protein